MNAICVYHDKDFDGMGSACVVKRWLDANGIDGDFVGWDYGRDVPWFKDYDMVFVVDISFGVPAMKLLASQNGDFIWLDHHISAIDEYEKYVADTGDNFMRGLWTSKRAACENCWEYLFAGVPMPEYLELLGKYDSWRGADTPEWDERIYPFQLWCKSKFNDWKSMYAGLFARESGMGGIDAVFVQNAIDTGRAIVEYVKTDNEFKAKKNAYSRDFEGMRALCMVGVIGSPSFDAVWDPAKYDVMIAINFDGKQWSCGMYTTHEHIDCSAICKRLGGGGHRKASGFRFTGESPLL